MPSTRILSLFAELAATDVAANVLAAARALATQLARSRPLDRRLVANVMTTAFGASDAEGAWAWRDAYDAIEAATVLQIRRLAPQVGRLEDAPAEIAALLAAVSGLGLTHTRRSEEQVVFDQFSTPPQWASLLVLAAQIRPGDRVLEPSAGTGLLAAVAEDCGAVLTLNEIAPQRAELLDRLFPGVERSRYDGRHIHDLSEASGAFDAVLANPPFSDLAGHLEAGLKALADDGRLSAIVPLTALTDEPLLRRLSRIGVVIGRLALPRGAFAKHGTSVETGVLVMDRRDGESAPAPLILADDLEAAVQAVAALPPRVGAMPRVRHEVSASAFLGPRERRLALPCGRLAFLGGAAPVAYAVQAWAGEGRDIGLYQAHALARIDLADPRPHPSPLVESGPMASVPPPAPTYRPILPPSMRDEGRISDAQTETVIYAGEAHGAHLPGRWRLGEAAQDLVFARDDQDDATPLRRGFFLGDGTGCGKGRQIAAVIADNMAQGRVRALWLSRNDALLEDARRDWAAIGGGAHDIVPLLSWKQGDVIRLDRGVLFTTYATLRQPARGGRPSRLDQIVAWLGAGFDGVIAFDEAHAMANAAGGGKGARETRKASLQGMAGLALQNRLAFSIRCQRSATWMA